MAQVTHFFAGANSGDGFQNLFSEIVDLEDTYDLMVLKGGPGVGKATFMREIGRSMEEAGTPVEYLWCSGDPDSLDGLVLPQLGVAIVDGTAPHVVEAKYPAVVERYVNLGRSYDAAGLQDVREEIMGAMEGYPACYQRAYRCLGAAERLREEEGLPGAKKVLRAAALTYVAALLMSLLQLMRFVLIFLGRNNRGGGRD